jgi:large subunit ribosomal protein L23
MGYDNLKSLIYTEKSNRQLSDGKYYFKVDQDCNKLQLKKLIKSFFNVDVEKVNVSNVTGKTKRFKGITGKRKSYKKAIITLKKGQSINLESLK